jgi:poly(A) polymerase
MENYRFDLSHPVFALVAEAAQELNLEVYAVGGFVRDQLLDRNCKDIDFVCAGSPLAEVKRASRWLSALLKK